MNQFPHCHLIPTRKAITYLPCQTSGIHFTNGFRGKLDCSLGERMAVFGQCHESCSVMDYSNFIKRCLRTKLWKSIEFELSWENGSFSCSCHASVLRSRLIAGQRFCYHLFMFFSGIHITFCSESFISPSFTDLFLALTSPFLNIFQLSMLPICYT